MPTVQEIEQLKRTKEGLEKELVRIQERIKVLKDASRRLTGEQEEILDVRKKLTFLENRRTTLEQEYGSRHSKFKQAFEDFQSDSVEEDDE